MKIQCLFKKPFGFKLNNSLLPPFLICTLLTAHFMDINFNGTIITLFGSLPLEMLGSQGGAGSGPSRLDVFCSKESLALAMGTCHLAKGEVAVAAVGLGVVAVEGGLVMEKGGGRGDPHHTHTLRF